MLAWGSRLPALWSLRSRHRCSSALHSPLEGAGGCPAPGCGVEVGPCAGGLLLCTASLGASRRPCRGFSTVQGGLAQGRAAPSEPWGQAASTCRHSCVEDRPLPQLLSFPPRSQDLWEPGVVRASPCHSQWTGEPEALSLRGLDLQTWPRRWKLGRKGRSLWWG